MAAGVKEKGIVDRTVSNKTVFVRGLPYSTTDADLEQAFSSIGSIKTSFTVKERGSKDCRGFGYVVFSTSEDANKSVQADLKCGGRKLNVCLARKRKPPSPPKKDKDKDKKAEWLEEGNDKEVGSGEGDEDTEADEEEEIEESNKEEVTVKPARAGSKGEINAVKKTKRRQPETAVGRTLVITGIKEGVTKKQIYKRCRKVGDVESATFPVEGSEEVTAEVIYKTYKESRTALSKLDGSTFKGSVLKVVAKSRQGKTPSLKALKKSRLIVRNVSFQATESDLRGKFSPFGTVQEVNIAFNNEGRRRGFAFVQFTNVLHASKAMDALNGTEVKGRPIAVDWVVPKTLYENSKLTSATATTTTTTTTTSSSNDDGNGGDDTKESHSREETENGDGTLDDDDSDHESVQDDRDSSDDEDEDEDDDDEDENEDDENSGSDEDMDLDKGIEKDRKSKSSKQVVKPVQKPKSDDVEEGKTVFIRNVPFDCEQEDVDDLFSQFGEIVYCKLVFNPDTGVPKGTAFVKFSTAAEARACVAAATDEAAGDSYYTEQSGLMMDGRKLDVVVAVSRQQAASLIKPKNSDGSQQDRRNLYLSKEGQILPNSDESKNLTKAEMAKRMRSLQEKKTKLANPNFFVSKTRLSVRNLPPSLTEKELRQIFIKGASGTRPHVKQVKILRSSDQVDSSGQGQSKGCGFVEFVAHESALAALRTLNNNPDILPARRKLIVEFSIENAKALQVQKDRQYRQSKYLAQSENQGQRNGSDVRGNAARDGSQRAGTGRGQWQAPFRGDSGRGGQSWRKRGPDQKTGGPPNAKKESFASSPGGYSAPERTRNPNPKTSAYRSPQHFKKQPVKDLKSPKKTVAQPAVQKKNEGESDRSKGTSKSPGSVFKNRSRKRRREAANKREINLDRLVDAHSKSVGQ